MLRKMISPSSTVLHPLLHRTMASMEGLASSSRITLFSTRHWKCSVDQLNDVVMRSQPTGRRVVPFSLECHQWEIVVLRSMLESATSAEACQPLTNAIALPQARRSQRDKNGETRNALKEQATQQK